MTKKPAIKRSVLKDFKLQNNPPRFVPKINGPMSLCGQAEDAISTLEARLSKIIRRINSINEL